MHDNWKECELGDVITLKRGYDLPSTQRETGSIPIVTSSGLGATHSTAKVKGPGVVTGRYGTIGQVFYVTEDFWPLNTTLYVQDFKGNDPKYISYLLRTLNFQAYSDKAAVPGLNRNHLHMARVLLAPPDAQRRISHILGTLDAKIELNHRQNETLESLARALFQSWFVDFDPVRAKASGEAEAVICQRLGLSPKVLALFPAVLEDSILGEVPMGWKVGKLEDLCVLQRGFDLPASARTAGKYSVISAGGIHGTHNEFMVKGPGIVTGRSGVIGNVFLVQDDFWPLNTTLWVKKFMNVGPNYIYQLLNGIDLKSFNAGSAVPSLNRNHVHTHPVVVPNEEIADAYEAFATTLFQRKKVADENSYTLAALRDELLPRLLSGELSVLANA